MTSSARPPVAFLGLGIMGSAMANALLKANFPLTVWNRSRRPAEELGRAGARVSDTPAEAVGEAEFILYSLADDEAIKRVVFGPDGVLTGSRRGQLVANLSTVHPEMSRREATAFAEKAVAFVDAPVFGSQPEAQAAELCIVVGGAREDYERVRLVLEALSASTHYMGGTGKGATMGLIGSLVVCQQLEALGESLVLAQKAGLGVRQVVDILGLADFRSPILTGMGTKIVRRRFAPVFSLDHLYKDANQILQLAQQLDVPVPGCAVVRETIKGAVSHGWGHENASALIKSLELQANLVVKDQDG